MALATGDGHDKPRQTLAAYGLLIESFNGKPQALPLNFATPAASPLNENDRYTTKSTPLAPDGSSLTNKKSRAEYLQRHFFSRHLSRAS